MTYYAERRQLVDGAIRAASITDERVLEAFRAVPRHEFVPAEYRRRAYLDKPVPIGEGQTTSQPSLVAIMTSHLQLDGDDTVLEVGTGSGYQAAILGELAREVYTIERFASLAKAAERRLDRLGYDNVHVIVGDGTEGLPDKAPFDAIIVTAGAPHIPQPLVDQLQEGGRLVIPVGDYPHTQRLKVAVKHGDGVNVEETLAARFVPLVGEYGWDSDQDVR